MKKLMLSVFALAAVVFSASAEGPSSGPISANGSAILLSSITLSKTNDLNFGQITKGSDDGEITMTASAAGFSAIGITSGTSYTLLTGVTRTAAKFHVIGYAGASYTITLPVTASLTGGVTITNFNTFPNLTRIIPTENNFDDFYVGGVLNLPVDAVAGVYSGSFDVTVAYN